MPTNTALPRVGTPHLFLCLGKNCSSSCKIEKKLQNLASKCRCHALADVVSVLLKTAAGDDTEHDAAKLIHQCVVRRHIVVELIRTMNERGHRAYKHVEMEQVDRNANALPDNAAPPEIFRFLAPR